MVTIYNVTDPAHVEALCEQIKGRALAVVRAGGALFMEVDDETRLLPGAGLAFTGRCVTLGVVADGSAAGRLLADRLARSHPVIHQVPSHSKPDSCPPPRLDCTEGGTR